MLATVAPRWPKAFTKIGFGTIAIVLFFSVMANAILKDQVIELRSDLQEIRSTSASHRDSVGKVSSLNDGLLARIEAVEREINVLEDSTFLSVTMWYVSELEEKEALIYGTALLFISYLVGEVLIYLGSFLAVLILWEKNYSSRIARVAYTSNPVIQKQFEELESLQAIVSGLVGLSITSFLAVTISFLESGGTSSFLNLLKSFFGFASFAIFAAYASARMARTLDLTLEELSALLDRNISGD